MASLDSVRTDLKNIHDRTQTLTAAVISLNESCEAESVRLNRQEAVHRLELIRTAILRDLERARGRENVARYAQTKTDVAYSLTGSAIKLLTRALTDNQHTRKFVNNVLSTSHHDKPTFGTVMVCIGPKGLPGDIRVISVSELARKSNRLESEIVRELRHQDCLLFGEEAFSSLVDKLTELVREGHLVLPFPKEKVAELMTSSRLEWRQGRQTKHRSICRENSLLVGTSEAVCHGTLALNPNFRQ